MAVEQSQVLNKTFTTKILSQIENLKLVTDSVQIIWYANVTKKRLAGWRTLLRQMCPGPSHQSHTGDWNVPDLVTNCDTGGYYSDNIRLKLCHLRVSRSFPPDPNIAQIMTCFAVFFVSATMWEYQTNCRGLNYM